jgi:glycosyl transferase, family 25
MNNYKELNGAVFVISLKNSARRSHIIKEFSKIDLDFEFIDAVEGKTLKLKEDPRINYEKVSKYPSWLTPGMIGCSLSHINCYERIISENLDFALIFEDDICFHSDIKELIFCVKQNSFPSEVTMFYYQSFDEIILENDKLKKITARFSITELKKEQTLISTAGYMIGREAALKMRNYLLPVHTGPDSWKEFCDNNLIKKINVIYPMPCYNACFHREIYHKGRLKHRIIESVGNFIDRLKMPFLQSYLRKRRSLYIKKTQKIKIR